MTSVRQRVIEYFRSHPWKALKTKELARALNLPKQGGPYQELKRILRTLQNDGEIDRVDGRKWTARVSELFLTGTLQIGDRGPGTVITAEGTELIIPRRLQRHAENGDRVRVRAQKAPDGSVRGEIVEIVGRAPKKIVGRVKRWRGSYVIESDGKTGHPRIEIASRKLHGAREGDKVVVELDDEAHFNSGRIVEILGRHGVEAVEMQALLHRYGLTTEFPQKVLEEANAIEATIPAQVLADRLDLRDAITFTIDPEDAKDFDDAVSLEITDQGEYKLGVHIADVSHYIRQNTELDAEAFRRGTSVYLVDGVVPMLPERLSNSLCSLEQGRARLTYSVLMTVTPRGKVTRYSFRKSVIRSHRRFTYEEVEQIIENGQGEFSEILLNMNKLASTLTRKRLREGGIDFSVPEVQFVLDDHRFPVEIKPKPRLRSMRLIEEFMLLANRTVAQHVTTMAGKNREYPFLYRVHDLPSPEKVEELVEFLQHLGVHVVLEPTSARSFQQMLESLTGRPESDVVQDITIRSMAKALYSPNNIGHFGLGFHHYTHFTSPIRRYPDLVVHRLLSSYIDASSLPYTGQQLAEIGRSTSNAERNAVEAERESVKIKEIEYMKRHLGDEFDAVISGVTRYGFYVELIPFLVEGLVHIRSLTDDFYHYDAAKKSLVGRRRQRVFRLGDRVRVQVVRVDMSERQMDFLVLS